MTIDLTKELADGERLQKVINANSWHNCGTNVLDINGAAAEFAAPYLTRIAELEAKNKALRETAAEFVCATDMLKTKMGTIEQNDRWRAAHASILVLVRDDP